MQKKETFSIQEIASWPETREVILPNVQRGFVWKASQIENLWDSLLRGYPVGAFVLTPNKLEHGRFEMLDGQQRATAICLGFNKTTYRKTKYRVFIDLEQPASTDNREYFFRVITPSHPWGYQKTDNTKTLTSDNKRHAMDFYRTHCKVIDPFDINSLDKVFPYDSTLPIPFEFFINAAIENEINQLLHAKIFEWLTNSFILDDWTNEIDKIKTDLNQNNKSKKKLPSLTTREDLKVRINTIYARVLKILDNDGGQRIPALYLDIDEIDRRKDADISTSNKTSQKNEGDEELEESDPIENLFIRLNDGGTPLRGEELNYSILKANIDKTLQELIESSCKGYIKPARFISIAFRLFQHQNKFEEREGLSLKIKPKQFQRAINSKQNKKAFLQFLNKILKEDKNYDNETLINYSKNILSYKVENNTYALPHIIVNSISEKAPEIMFLFLYRILNKDIKQGDRFVFGTELHRKMLGVLTSLMWLGKSEKQRNYNRLLRNIWPAAESLETELFWSSIAIQRAMLDSSFNTPPTLSELNKLKKLFTEKIRRDTDIIGKRMNGSSHADFIDNMMTYKNRDIVLYAQRAFLAKVISNDHLLMDDTDVPFDWDHISPNSYVYGLQDIPQIIRDWYNSNGNFRAWPYSLNRMDQDVSPAKKLDPLGKQHYANDSEKFVTIKNQWQEFISYNKEFSTNEKNLRNDLLDWSACDKKWALCNITNLKEKNNWATVFQLITVRNFQLINNWYSELRIKDLLPKKQVDKFNIILNNKQWSNNFVVNANRELTKFLKENLTFENSSIWVTKALDIDGTKFHFYLVADKNTNRMLRNSGVIFGILFSINNTGINIFKIPEPYRNIYVTDQKTYSQGYFTLSSHENESYIHLINKINSWLGQYPIVKHQVALTNLFLNTIKSSFKNNIN